MSVRKKITVGEYFDKNSRKFIKFGEKFAEILNDDAQITSLAEKDLEKLAKVWKLVFEMLIENYSENSSDKLSMLIGEYKQLGEENDE